MDASTRALEGRVSTSSIHSSIILQLPSSWLKSNGTLSLSLGGGMWGIQMQWQEQVDWGRRQEDVVIFGAQWWWSRCHHNTTVLSLPFHRSDKEVTTSRRFHGRSNTGSSIFHVVRTWRGH